MGRATNLCKLSQLKYVQIPVRREVQDTKARGYRQVTYLASNEHLRNVIDNLATGEFSRNEPDLVHPVMDSLRSEAIHGL